MLSHKLDFSSCAWKPGFVKSSHICSSHILSVACLMYVLYDTSVATCSYVLCLNLTKCQQMGTV